MAGEADRHRRAVSRAHRRHGAPRREVIPGRLGSVRAESGRLRSRPASTRCPQFTETRNSSSRSAKPGAAATKCPAPGAISRSARSSVARASQIRSSAARGRLRRQAPEPRLREGRRAPVVVPLPVGVRLATTNPPGDFLGERPLVDVWSTGELQELAQRCGVRIEAMGEHRVSHVLEVGHVGIARNQVEERRLDEGQRAHERGRARSCDQRPQRLRRSARRRADARSSSGARSGGVDVEVLTRARW